MLSEHAHPALLDRAACAVLVVDVQDAFRDHIEDFHELVDQIRLLVRAANILGVPVACSEQYPRGLGSTVDAIVEVLPADAVRFDKLEFAACDAATWASLPPVVRDARQFVVVGIEAHVCVRQTTLALLADGRQVHVPTDAVASRSTRHRDVAVRELARVGARESTVEQVLFDWLRAAGSQEFKDVQALLKPGS